ncbi:hypothetical protein [uncultured Ruminococcus sp.]|uniref:hypothetical protein n=1 Tax=uncultured Ruminococcus sp. TaxID=165186 RepID=UPI0025D3DF05|nr:hypothetical protein [uncultured Ruminococcus sp.]
MRKKSLVIAAAAALCLAGCADNKNNNDNEESKKPGVVAESSDEGTDSEEESTIGLLQDMTEGEPSVINGIILESQSTWKTTDGIEKLAEEGFTKTSPNCEFELDEVFEMYIDTESDDPWNVYICRHEDIEDRNALTEEKLAELSDKDGYANKLGNTPDRENYGDIGGMCVASDESAAGQYDMFFVHNGKIDSFMELEITEPSNAE